jgi:radical SAM superfamily enzyme YgiQ (UPF0313 family)
MIKIFLGNPPWTEPGYYGVRAGSRWPHLECEASRYMPFPFFLAYATAVLEKNGYTPCLVDAAAERIPAPVFMHKLEMAAPDVIVLETSTPSFPRDLEIVREIRVLLGSDPRIVLCGPHQLMMGEDFLEEHDEIDFVMRGEYEMTLLDLVKTIESGNELDTVNGLNYRDSSGVVHVNPDRPLTKDLDSLPWPSRHQLPMMEYYDEAAGVPQPSGQMWASRGCPYTCIFCVWPQLVYGGSNYRVRRSEDVAAEMEWLVKVYGYRSIYFDDDTFNIGKDRMLKLCQTIQARKLNVPWAIMARADTMDREILEAMATAGLYSVKYGVESAVQEIVDGCGKNLDLSRLEEIVGITRDLGIQYHLTFTFGLPGETFETARKTIDLALKLDPHTVQFSICTPMPGSKYFNMLEEKGFLESKDWSDYTGFNSAVARTETLTAKDLESILESANKAWADHVWKRQSPKDRFRLTMKKHASKIFNTLFPN